MENMRSRYQQGGMPLYALGKANAPKRQLGTVIDTEPVTTFKRTANQNLEASLSSQGSSSSGSRGSKRKTREDDEEDDIDLLSHPSDEEVDIKRIWQTGSKATKAPEKTAATKRDAPIKKEVSKRYGKELSDAPPSNQLALKHPKKTDSVVDVDRSSSPLSDINNHDRKTVTKPSKTQNAAKSRPVVRFPIGDVTVVSKSLEPAKKSIKARQIYPDITRTSAKEVSPVKVSKKVKDTDARQPASFPDLPELSSVPIKSKVKLKQTVKVRDVQQFPLDISAKSKKEKARRRSSGIQIIESDEEDDDDPIAMSKQDELLTFGGGPRPFPMALSSQPLSQTSTTKESGKSIRSKRSAEDSEDEKASKRSRPSPEQDDDLYDETAISFSNDKKVDPSTLCHYCDEPWPSTPSPALLALLERTKRKSYKDPRPGNVLGLTAPITVFIEVCQRHRFEMTLLPRALRKGWPTKIDWSRIPKRMEKFKKKLVAFVQNPSSSHFWRDLRDDMKEIGKTKIGSVSGQFATFERALPGYYGEQGSYVIHQTLYSIFPQDSIADDNVYPLSPDQFTTHVLVPESALLLIQEDMNLDDRAAALKIMEESKQFGVSMYPEQAQGDDVTEVGERLAKQRAEERRKLLEERGETDADVRRQVEEEEREAKKPKPKPKPVMKPKKDVDMGSVKESGDELKLKKPKIKSKPVAELPISAGPTPVERKPKKRQNDEDEMDMGLETPRPGRVISQETSVMAWREKPNSSSSDAQPQTGKKTSSKKRLPVSLSSPTRPPKTSTMVQKKEDHWNRRLLDDPVLLSSDDEDPPWAKLEEFLKPKNRAMSVSSQANESTPRPSKKGKTKTKAIESESEGMTDDSMSVRASMSNNTKPPMIDLNAKNKEKKVRRPVPLPVPGTGASAALKKPFVAPKKMK
ncbi:hypothetical protein M422DRAFT_199977 [Sphaerobolus stellatus SS14]|nr:hypothetical protein M422DRAFT_199977 [Sphaerobolus stellatus SS14]